MRKAGETGEESDELFHRARKAAKRHRYAVEAAAPVWGSKADKLINDRKDLQDVLGAHQDRIVQAAFLRELGAPARRTVGPERLHLRRALRPGGR